MYLLGRAAALYFRHFWLIAALVLTVWLPGQMVYTYVEYEVLGLGYEEVGEDSATFEEGMDEFLILMQKYQWLDNLFELVFGSLSFACVMGLLGAASRGEQLSYGRALGFGFRRWLPVMASTFLLGIALFVSFLALIIPFFFFVIRLCLVTVVTAFEGWGGSSPFHRSMELTHGSYWRIFGVFLVFLVMLILIVMVIGILIYVPIAILNPQAMDEVAGTFYVDIFFDLLIQVLATYGAVLSFAIYQDGLTRLYGPVEPA